MATLMFILTLFYVFVVLTFLFEKHEAIKIGKYIAKMVFVIIYKLGETLLMAGVVGTVFIPEEKDFTKALIAGIILFIIGYITNNKK